MSENRFSCGPFTRCTEADLQEALRRLGLSVTDDAAPPAILREGGGGLRIEARGASVRGYFLADDGEEAEQQDVKRLVLACCEPQLELRLSGSVELAPGRLLVIASRASHDGRIVQWTSTRTVISAAGGARTFRESA